MRNVSMSFLCSSPEANSWPSLFPLYPFCFCPAIFVVFAIILACVQYFLFCLRTLDVIRLTANRSSAVSVARTVWSTHAWLVLVVWIVVWTSSKEALLSASWLLSACSLRPWWLGSVVSFSGSLSITWGSPSAVASTTAACAGAGHLLAFLFVCVIILIIRRCVVWSFFFISSVIVHMPEAQRSDGRRRA